MIDLKCLYLFGVSSVLRGSNSLVLAYVTLSCNCLVPRRENRLFYKPHAKEHKNNQTALKCDLVQSFGYVEEFFFSQIFKRDMHTLNSFQAHIIIAQCFLVSIEPIFISPNNPFL